ncbi:MAG: hypothetical protein MJ189_04920, partial [Coriobacteriales bacterium]|nr:hypothetical protein [Coriobacteriales bacterium]
MLNAKENMLAVMKGTNPDRFVNQYEALTIFVDPYFMFTPAMPEKGGGELVNAWGITNVFPENTPGSFPVHTPDKLVVKDIENWKEYVKPPELNFSNEQWDI